MSEQRSPCASALRNAVLHSAIFSKIGTDDRGVTQVFNGCIGRLLGHPPAEVVDKLSLLCPCDPEEPFDNANAVADEMHCTGGSGFDAPVFKASRGIEEIHEATCLRKDGLRVTAIVSVSALRGAGGATGDCTRTLTRPASQLFERCRKASTVRAMPSARLTKAMCGIAPTSARREPRLGDLREISNDRIATSCVTARLPSATRREAFSRQPAFSFATSLKKSWPKTAGSLSPSQNLTVNAHPRNENQAALHFHSDVSNAFYALWLDPAMVYSCAYYETPDLDPASAQHAKLDLICRKLLLQPGDKFLDIGCGWGALLIHAAKHYSVQAHGVTLSRQQLELARERIAEAGLESSVTVDLRDYRDLAGEDLYGKVASVGMFEHVGSKNLLLYFTTIRRLLKPKGLFLNHGITHDVEGSNNTLSTEFINRYIFPDGQLDNVGNILRGMEKGGFEIVVQQVREHPDQPREVAVQVADVFRTDDFQVLAAPGHGGRSAFNGKRDNVVDVDAGRGRRADRRQGMKQFMGDKGKNFHLSRMYSLGGELHLGDFGCRDLKSLGSVARVSEQTGARRHAKLRTGKRSGDGSGSMPSMPDRA